MHILFLSDNFPPETNAPATRTYEHARVWVREGHRVTVITCAPNFPEGRVHPGYANRWVQREELDGIEVVRVKTYIAANAGFGRRILDHLSFMVAGFLAGLFAARPDVVVATSPQFFCALGGWALAAVRRKPFVFELRDLWPESISAVGAMRPGPVLRLLEAIELFLYRRARKVVAVTPAFRADLERRGIDPSKVAIVTNGVDQTLYRPRPKDEELVRELDLEGKFVIGYLGTHGLAHALENVLDAADRLRGREDLCFLFAGSGAAREGLVLRARAMRLPNVRFAEPRPKGDMPRLWSVCDAALVHLKDTPLFSSVLPSKIFEAMGMGLPILYAGPSGEATGILESTGSGLAVPAEDPAALAEAAARMASDRDMVSRLAQASLAAAPSFDRASLARTMLQEISLQAAA